MSPGPTFDRVYLWLKEQLVAGALAPGSSLEPAHLTDALATSITPIRDALHRLAGERLVDASWGEGFRVPAPTEADLRELYGWNLALLDLAVRIGRRALFPRLSPAQSDRMEMAEIALAIAQRGGRELTIAVASANDRLGPARAAEPHILNGCASEHAQLRDLLERDDMRSLRRALTSYHRHRQRMIADIVVAMRERASS